MSQHEERRAILRIPQEVDQAERLRDVRDVGDVAGATCTFTGEFFCSVVSRVAAVAFDELERDKTWLPDKVDQRLKDPTISRLC